MFSNSDMNALVGWFLDRDTSADEIRQRLDELWSDQWRAFYVLADVALQAEERWMEPWATERRQLLEAERGKRGL